MELGDNLPTWLESKVAPLRPAAHPTRVIYHDDDDAADQFVEINHPDGTRSKCVIDAVLERLPDLTPTRWAIADITPDTS